MVQFWSAAETDERDGLYGVIPKVARVTIDNELSLGRTSDGLHFTVREALEVSFGRPRLEVHMC
jgi:hypothetical protein